MLRYSLGGRGCPNFRFRPSVNSPGSNMHRFFGILPRHPFSPPLRPPLLEPPPPPPRVARRNHIAQTVVVGPEAHPLYSAVIAEFGEDVGPQ